MRLKLPEHSTSDIIGLADARERERLATPPGRAPSRGWPRHGSLGRWVLYGLVLVLIGGWAITVLTRLF